MNGTGLRRRSGHVLIALQRPASLRFCASRIRTPAAASKAQTPRAASAFAFFIPARAAGPPVPLQTAQGQSPCRFCLSEDIYAVYVSPAGNPLMHCSQCGGYWFPGPQETREYYNEAYAEEHRLQYLKDHQQEYESGRYDDQLDTLEHHLGKRKLWGRRKILDFGSHYAFLLKKAKERGMDAVSVEYDAEVARYNREQLGIETRELQEVPGGSCDIVYASHVVEHLPDPAGTLHELATKLRKGGILAMTSPCFSAALVRSDTLRLQDMAYPGHLSYFTLEAAVKTMERAGLEIEHKVSQFADGGQALRCLGEGIEGDAGRLAGPLQEEPFCAGTNLFAVGRKARDCEPARAETRTLKVSRLSEARGLHRILDGELLVPLPPGPSFVSGNIAVLSTPGVSPPVTVGLGGGDTAEVRPNGGPRSFVLYSDGSRKELAVRGGKETEVFLHDLVWTARANL